MSREVVPVNIRGLIPLIPNISNLENIENIENIEVLPDPYILIHQNNYPNISYNQLYSRTSTNNTNWVTIIPDGGAGVLPLIPSPSQQLAFSGDMLAAQNDITTQFIITYYADNVTTTVSQQIITLNGINKVLITGTMYRIVNIQVNPAGPAPIDTAIVYFYDSALNPVNGVPPSYYDLVRIAPGPTDRDWET